MENKEKQPVVLLIDESDFGDNFEDQCNRLVKEGYEFVSSNSFIRPDCVNPTYTAVLINKDLLSVKKSNGCLRAISSNDTLDFEDQCNRLIRKGYRVSSSYSDVDADDHTFYQAIMVKE
jgi:hypothetical protein